MPRSGAVRLAFPGSVVRGGPERSSVELGHDTHVVRALTVLERGTSDTCSMIAWPFLSGKSDRSVNHYIVRGLCVTASQTTQNNKLQLTKRCTPL